MEMLGDRFWGWFFLTIGSISLVGFLYAAILSKLLPPSDNAIISSIQNDCWSKSDVMGNLIVMLLKELLALIPLALAFDRYNCFLVPLTLPVLMVAVYFHWLCMKLFKHA
ncbi:hypothetical protein FNV43_RR02937 [Rhamnella rubrinervis]|uniref:Uncharacterized protein n=1 Tax=Rhamnella rubrinervis TaxID=2594499 RepID=A0A8K0HIV1_9ROSA|nr:hypothetical protein FNV43_RR02937 [Rhamnella rubrinervis]